jgi:hypothetical protein
MLQRYTTPTDYGTCMPAFTIDLSKNLSSQAWTVLLANQSNKWRQDPHLDLGPLTQALDTCERVDFDPE